MRPIAPFVIALCLGLAGCREMARPRAASNDRTLTDARAVCSLSGQATTVRYQTRRAAYSEQAIQLLNGFDAGMVPDECAGAVPMASIVTLRYRIAGG
ncbi:MAG: hypothetical protein U5R48_17395 [Gammaproteobacteria bacterium]|nr:hypothetical protein [Gammaproteobacteria bacterium]